MINKIFDGIPMRMLRVLHYKVRKKSADLSFGYRVVFYISQIIVAVYYFLSIFNIFANEVSDGYAFYAFILSILVVWMDIVFKMTKDIYRSSENLSKNEDGEKTLHMEVHIFPLIICVILIVVAIALFYGANNILFRGVMIILTLGAWWQKLIGLSVDFYEATSVY